jgi:hypothetical protein
MASTFLGLDEPKKEALWPGRTLEDAGMPQNLQQGGLK